ncbi:uncharacterized protein LOC124322473 [Daphnia pulicaria]|uniref:uncharacterized protein LOC124322473 n=1 Tax=Daphnia pulicaria TaxID=35523 RepID=UPI001EEAF6AE|nr:uncharacterized protein LOC124322473 [Daphnia pulicaria]
MGSIEIDGIGKGYLKKMRLMGIQNEYDILQRFKKIEDKSWEDDPPDKEDPTRVFIDGLINIISKIRYPPKGIGEKDAKTEVENANQLIEKVEELTKEKMISKDTRKTTADIVEGLKNKSGDPAIFKTFLCCLLMSDSLKKNECDVFSGVFKSWDWLQKLDQVGDTELQQLFETETAKIYRKVRTQNVETGFKRIISLISEDGNKALEMGKLHSFCEKEEVIRDEFYKFFTNCKITRPNFTRCYASVKQLLSEFAKITQTNENLEHHLEWEVEEMLRVFRLSPPSFETENGTNRLQKQLANLWNKVKNKLNDPEEWNRFTESESPKVTTPDNATDSSSNHDKIKCLQINLNRSNEAWEKLIHQWLAEEKVGVVFIQEPCLNKIGNEQTNDCCYYFPGLPRNYRAVHNNYLMDEDKKSKYDRSAAILVHVDVPFERILPMAATTDNYTHPQELMVGIRLTGNGWDGVTLFSIYCRPIRSLALLLKPLRSLGNHDMTVLCMDANATHPNWSPDWEDKGLYSGRGEDLEDFRAFCKLQVANRNLEDKKKSIEKQATEDNEGDTSDEDKTEANNDSERNSKNIDVTLYGTKLRIAKWERLEDKSSSDHRYITFSIFRNYPGGNSKKSSTLLSALGDGGMSCLGRTRVTKSHQLDNLRTNEE